MKMKKEKYKNDPKRDVCCCGEELPAAPIQMKELSDIAESLKTIAECMSSRDSDDVNSIAKHGAKKAMWNILESNAFKDMMMSMMHDATIDALHDWEDEDDEDDDDDDSKKPSATREQLMKSQICFLADAVTWLTDIVFRMKGMAEMVKVPSDTIFEEIDMIPLLKPHMAVGLNTRIMDGLIKKYMPDYKDDSPNDITDIMEHICKYVMTLDSE